MKDRVGRVVGLLTRCSSAILLVSLLVFVTGAMAQSRRSEKSFISGGMLVVPSVADSVADSVEMVAVVGADSLVVEPVVEVGVEVAPDSLATEGSAESQRTAAILSAAQSTDEVVPLRAERHPFISDSMSLSRVCWTAAVLPGFGQAYNKQYWKMPILYSTLALGTTLFVKENKKYQPLKAQYDEMTLTDMYRTDELNELQGRMIRSNTRRQLYLGATLASYIYFLGDAAVNYATNDVSNVKRATTLATIFPGAGQIYNKQYWKVPFVVGGFAAMIYVIDWNNRGYQRFNKAYLLLLDYDNNPDNYPDGPLDEFGGRYSTDYMESLRDSYRRNRDLSIIMTAGLYLLQIIDAHVDAHFQNFDISDDLSLRVEPTVGYTYSPTANSDKATYGFNVEMKF
ncbi:MAG: DUF5683 domain-containing protein [Rikenellaceae bacterium]